RFPGSVGEGPRAGRGPDPARGASLRPWCSAFRVRCEFAQGKRTGTRAAFCSRQLTLHRESRERSQVRAQLARVGDLLIRSGTLFGSLEQSSKSPRAERRTLPAGFSEKALCQDARTQIGALRFSPVP